MDNNRNYMILTRIFSTMLIKKEDESQDIDQSRESKDYISNTADKKDHSKEEKAAFEDYMIQKNWNPFGDIRTLLIGKLSGVRIRESATGTVEQADDYSLTQCVHNFIIDIDSDR